MGHHSIQEVSHEKFEFQGKAKLIPIVLIVLGAVLAIIGSLQVKNNWDNVGHHAQTNDGVTYHESAPNHHIAHADDHHNLGHVEDTLKESHDETRAHETTNHNDQHTKADAHATVDHADEHHGPTWMTRVWANLLMNSYYFWLFAVAAIFFIAVNYVANAGWAVMLKRIMEAQSSYLLIGSILLIGIIIGAKDTLYHWVQYFHSPAAGNPDAAGYDRILESKSWLLNNTSLFFFIPFVTIVWILIRMKLRKNSLAEDQEKGLTMFKNSTRWSAGFIFFFAFSFSALSWLIIMSIDAHWYSTMFSVYNFAVSFVTGLSVMMVILQYLKITGKMTLVSDEVVHDLGKFMFAFCVFWAYIFLSQWLLIWYTNLPEETTYFADRLEGGYRTLFFVNLFMCFVAPFLVLMMRNAKRSPIVLLTAASVILIGHWIDMYLLIMPGTVGEHAGIGLLEIGTTISFFGIFAFTVLRSLSKANLYPINHPYVLESANHDVGP